MKKIAVLSMVVVMIGITSCKKYLEIQPQHFIGDNLAVSSLQGLSQGVTGAFSQLQSANLYGGGIIANSELMADFVNPDANVLSGSGFGYDQIYSHQFNGYNTSANGMWDDGYSAILTVNTVLQYLPNFQTQNPSTCNLLRGECLFIRGALHFELVRMFAQPSGFTVNDSHLGVPILLAPGTSTTQQNNPRATVAQVYAQAIADLRAADSLLMPTATPSGAPDWVSKYAAEAYLARVYFSQHNYAQAEAYASEVISSGAFTLNTSLTAAYADTFGENIFFIYNTAKNDPGYGTLHGNFNVAPFGSTVPGFAMNAPFVSILTSAHAVGDLRYKYLYRNAFGSYYCNKYNYPYADVAVIRLAEMYLTRAECEAQLGAADATVRADYNMTRVRAGLPPDASTSGQTALLAAVRSERDLELSMEGDHYYEVKRRQGSFSTPGAGLLQWNAPTMIYPIPQQEMQENKNMVQNPGY